MEGVYVFVDCLMCFRKGQYVDVVRSSFLSGFD